MPLKQGSNAAVMKLAFNKTNLHLEPPGKSFITIVLAKLSITKLGSFRAEGVFLSLTVKYTGRYEKQMSRIQRKSGSKMGVLFSVMDCFGPNALQTSQLEYLYLSMVLNYHCSQNDYKDSFSKKMFWENKCRNNFKS